MYRGKPVNLFVYGDGSDGELTVTSGTTTLARDMYYRNVTVNSGCFINIGGFRLFVQNNLINNGTIHRNGNAASGITGGAVLAVGTLGGGDAGGSAYDEPVTPVTTTNSIGGSGGSAGAGGGSNVTAVGVTFGGPVPVRALREGVLGNSSTRFRVVGGGGGGGGQNGSQVGGGGGGGAAVVLVSARKITGSGAINAIGGAGADANQSGSGSGGGGGGGGGVIIICGLIASTITTSAAGGAGGLKGPGGTSDGAAGASGNVITIKNGIPR